MNGYDVRPLPLFAFLLYNGKKVRMIIIIKVELQ